MVEMLMAAFIMAVGILGLTMLQTYSIRSQTSGKSVDIAVQVAQQILDQAEMLGRNSVVSSRAGVAPPTLSPNYFGTAAITQTFSAAGLPVATGAYFTAVITPTTVPGATATGVVAPITGMGGIALLSVTVSWTESVSGAGATTTRNLTLNRRINYANS